MEGADIMIPKLTVIISTKNRHEEFLDCLNSVLEFTYNKYDLIIIDAGSDDVKTRDLLKEFRPTLPERTTVIYLNTDVPGYAEGNNMAMKMSRTPYIFLLNNDNQVTRDWDKPLIEMLEQDKHIGWIGPIVLWGDDVVQSAGALVTKDGASISIAAGQKVSEIQVERIACHYLGFGMYRKDLLEQIGYLSEEYQYIYFDDTDYGLMINNADYSVICTPLSRIYHLMSDKERERWKNLDPYSLNQPVFLNKWKEWLLKHGK